MPGGIFQQAPGTKVPISPHAHAAGGDLTDVVCGYPGRMVIAHSGSRVSAMLLGIIR